MYERGDTVWLATMGIFTAIDLLAKFYAGSDKGAVGEQFRKFLKDYLRLLGRNEAEVIYKLRNSMMHSFL